MFFPSSRAVSRHVIRPMCSLQAVHALPSAMQLTVAPPSSTAVQPLTVKHQNYAATQCKQIFPIQFRQFSSDITAPVIKLYQYHICPFCNITKSALSYANLDYEAVEVNPLTKAELKPWYVLVLHPLCSCDVE